MSVVLPTAIPQAAATVEEGSKFQIAGGQIVLILCGLIASGKSTFAEALQREYPEFHRCNQDDLGDRRLVEQLVRRTLNQGHSVCIDRTNFNEVQRSYWIKIAREFPQTAVWVIVFDTPYEVCAERLKNRTSHPTIKSPEQGLSVLSRFAADFQHPARWEGHERILHLKPSDPNMISPVYDRSDITAILMRIQNSPPIRTATPNTMAHRGRGVPTSGPSFSFRGNLNQSRDSGRSRGGWRGSSSSSSSSASTRPYPIHDGVPSWGRGSFSTAGPTFNRRESQNTTSYGGISADSVHGTDRTMMQRNWRREDNNPREKTVEGTGTGQDPFVID